MSEEKKYGLWEYMSEQHGLTLLESEVHEIIRLARAEMELPDLDEINQYLFKVWTESEDKADVTFNNGVMNGIIWALEKARNPYPYTIKFHRDNEDGVMSSQDYHKKLAGDVYQWAKLGLPFFWDLCVRNDDGSEWICMPPIDGKEIKLVSRHVYTDELPGISVSVEDFPKQFKILTVNEQHK